MAAGTQGVHRSGWTDGEKRGALFQQESVPIEPSEKQWEVGQDLKFKNQTAQELEFELGSF